MKIKASQNLQSHPSCAVAMIIGTPEWGWHTWEINRIFHNQFQECHTYPNMSMAYCRTIILPLLRHKIHIKFWRQDTFHLAENFHKKASERKVIYIRWQTCIIASLRCRQSQIPSKNRPKLYHRAEKWTKTHRVTQSPTLRKYNIHIMIFTWKMTLLTDRSDR